MSSTPTVPHGVSGMPLRTLSVQVAEGPDAGRSCTADALTVGTAKDNALVLTDATVSRYHLELSPRGDGIGVVDHGSTNGTYAGAVRIDKGIVASGTVLRLGRTSLRVGEGSSVTVEIHGADQLGRLRGRSPVMRRLMAQVERAARTETSVLVIGESGTGKELIARALHELGPRASGPIVTVDCGALSPTLVASELFGHERGAFTGAEQQHIGAFERARGGTLFLDEIGELPSALQSTLLGVLERRQFRRLGGRADIETDVRVVSATNRDLRAEVNAGTFRLDLYYRIAVVVLRIPPLRERREDVPLLAEAFLRECGHDGPIEALIPAPAMKALTDHRWPGNVRELRNLIEATVAMGEAPPLEPAEPARSMEDAFSRLLGMTYKEARTTLLAGFEARYLQHLLARTGGNVSLAAREAKMDRSHLIDLLRRHQLK